MVRRRLSALVSIVGIAFFATSAVATACIWEFPPPPPQVAAVPEVCADGLPPDAGKDGRANLVAGDPKNDSCNHAGDPRLGGAGVWQTCPTNYDPGEFKICLMLPTQKAEVKAPYADPFVNAKQSSLAK